MWARISYISDARILDINQPDQKLFFLKAPSPSTNQTNKQKFLKNSNNKKMKCDVKNFQF